MQDNKESTSPQGRPKRCSSEKKKKLELLEKIRSNVKSGKKNKYDLGELENVYEEVDEKEYSRTVLARQEEDWIVDDGGCGYIEDGREIFDDDLDEESIEKSKTVTSGRKRARDFAPISKKGNIRSMLAGMPAKKRKESSINLEEDDILGDLIGELGQSTSSADSSQSKGHNSILAPARRFGQMPPKQIKVDYEEWERVCKPIIHNKPQDYLKPKPLDILPLETEIKQEFVDELAVSEINSLPQKCKINEVDFPHEYKPLPVVKIKEEEPDAEDLWDSSCEIDFDCGDHIINETEIIKDSEKKKMDQESIKQEKKELAKDLPTDWDKSFDVTNDNPTLINIDRSKLSLEKNKNGEEILKFFYWDANEEIYNQPGTVFLFGKLWVSSASSFVSCCVIVKNIDRQIYLLPREKKNNGENVTMADVYEEFNTKITGTYKINQFKSRKSVKKFAFGKEDIPLESEYLEVRYPASNPVLPSNLSGETFSHVFGTRTSFLELLLLERSIKGPGWIEIVQPEPSNIPISWCKVEVVCNKPSYISYIKDSSQEIPPLVLVTLLPQMLYNQKNRQSEVIAVACLVNHSYFVDKPVPERLFNQHFCVLSRPSDFLWPFDVSTALQNFKKTNIYKMDSERALLNCLLTRLYKIDADIIVGHDLSGYAIELIISRLSFHKVPNWSRFGRLKRAVIPSSKSKNQLERIALTGRLLCDIKISAKELIRSRSYDLDALCQNVLHFAEEKRTDLTDEDFKFAFCNGSSLMDAVWHLMSDASYILRIFFELNVFPLALQITNIAGNVMSRTLMGGRSERNEFLLLHAFHNKGYILPDKEYKKNIVKRDPELEENPNIIALNSKSSRKKPSYAGGLVLDPKVGFYDDLILLMDFNSLYPSIIQEYNICFTSIPISDVLMEESFTDEYNKYFPNEDIEQGILPTEIRKLVESRKGVKELLRKSNLTSEQKMQYDIRQMALKLTANSMYGCLGFAHSRFYAKPLAALVTAKGREILMNTKKLVETNGYDVVYGDTDSIMINTKTKNFDQVYQIGKKIKLEVNKCYKQVELEIDGVFKYMLLLKKKKYAAVTLTKLPNGELREKREMKGLDIVRRDWSQISAEAGKYVLKQILSDQSADDRIENIHGYLENIQQDLESRKVPLPLLTVTKQLTKPPEEYIDKKALPHVQVALRINSNSAKRFKPGDTVSYVICKDGSSNPATQRAYHIEELKINSNLSIDVEYYLSQQIHPVIARLCDPIEGTDSATIARCLGLDPTKYQRQVQDFNESNEEGTFGKKEEEKFKYCETFSFVCKREECSVENVIDHPFRKLETGVGMLCLEHCINQGCTLSPIEYLPMIQNKLHLKIRSHIQKYSEGWLLCEDTTCMYRTNVINPVFEKAYPLCQKCQQSTMRREITSQDLYNQLSFYLYMFDISKATHKKVKYEPHIVAAYKKVYDQVNQVLSLNKYSVINLCTLFAQLIPQGK